MNKLKLLIAVLISWSMIGCDESGPALNPNPNVVSVPSYNVIEIEGCEYIVIENAWRIANNYNLAITHKGNCKNPIHKH